MHACWVERNPYFHAKFISRLKKTLPWWYSDRKCCRSNHYLKRLISRGTRFSSAEILQYTEQFLCLVLSIKIFVFLSQRNTFLCGIKKMLPIASLYHNCCMGGWYTRSLLSILLERLYYHCHCWPRAKDWRLCKTCLNKISVLNTICMPHPIFFLMWNGLFSFQNIYIGLRVNSISLDSGLWASEHHMNY